jgi:hypothetical protein
MRQRVFTTFFIGLSLLCATTLMYEIVPMWLLNVLCSFCPVFVSILMVTIAMTAGALITQLRPVGSATIRSQTSSHKRLLQWRFRCRTF